MGGGQLIFIFNRHWGGYEGGFVKFNSFLKNGQITQMWFKINLYNLFFHEFIIMLSFFNVLFCNKYCELKSQTEK